MADTRRVTVFLPEDDYEDLRLAAFQRREPLTQIMTAAFREWKAAREDDAERVTNKGAEDA